MWYIVIWYIALHSTHNMQNYDTSNAEHSFPAWMQMDCSCLFSWILVFPNIELDREVEWSLREAHMRKQADLPSSRRVSLEKVSLQQDMLIIRCCCCCCGNGIICCCLQYVQRSQHVEERYPTWSFPISITHWNAQHQHHQPQQQQQQRQLQLQPIPVTNTRWSPRSYLSKLIPHLTSSILPVTSQQFMLLGTCMASRVSPNWTNCWMMLPTSSRGCSWDPARWQYRDPVWRRLAEVW